jgi:hypothetical protein
MDGQEERGFASKIKSILVKPLPEELGVQFSLGRFPRFAGPEFHSSLPRKSTCKAKFKSV